MTRRLLFGILLLLVSLLPASAQERAIVVLDGSGSMWAQIEGEPRISIARDTLRTVLRGLPAGVELGLMTYGHRDQGDCSDIELLVPPGAGTTDSIIAAAQAINPKGKTPISEAVRQAAVELRYTEDKASVILITDGLETCEADPCALANELESSGVDFTTYVLGLGLTEQEGKQVACLAENTGGTYFSADNAEALTEALTTTVAKIAMPGAVPNPQPQPIIVAEAEPVPEPEPEPEPIVEAPQELPYNLAPQVVISEDGEPLTEAAEITWEVYRKGPDGDRGEYLSTSYDTGFTSKLEPGEYVLAAIMGEARSEQPITIGSGSVTRPLFVLNAATVHIRPMRMAGDDPAGESTVVVRYPGGDVTNYGESTVVVPAGEITVEVSIGKGQAVETFVARAGERIDKDIAVGVGRAVVNASYVEGMPVEDGDMATEILQAKKAIDGSRKTMDYGYGPGKGYDLPPGDYVAKIKMEATEVEVPFTVAAGELTEVNAVLEAGVLAVSAPTGYSIEILSTKKDIQGNRKSLAYGYSTEFQTTLPAGAYVVKVTMTDDSVKEAEAEVAAGERSELTVE